jgi:hypothetical protein
MRQAFLVVLFIAAGLLVYWGVGKLGQRMAVTYSAPELYPRMFEKNTDYDLSRVQTFVSNNPKAANYYVFPLLFPLDLFVMILLGGAAAYASVMSARTLGVPLDWIWLVLVLPVFYVAFDLVEDTLLALLLTDERTHTESFIWFVKSITTVKLASVIAAGAQTAALLVAVPLRWAVRAIWGV